MPINCANVIPLKTKIALLSAALAQTEGECICTVYLKTLALKRCY